MNVSLLFFCLSSFTAPPNDKVYTGSESTCSYYYSVTKDWTLTLKSNGIYEFKVQVNDGKAHRQSIKESVGTWSEKSDTLILSRGGEWPADWKLLKVSGHTLAAVNLGRMDLPKQLIQINP
jgi:hypothetical protein